MSDGSQRNAALVAAIVYPLTLAVSIVGFFRFYVPLLVVKDTVATAHNFAAHETMFRLYLGAMVVYGVGVVILVAALYVVLKPVSQGIATYAAVCRLIYAVMWFTQLLNFLGALGAVRGSGHLDVGGPEVAQATAAQHLALGWNAYYVGLGFYGMGTLAFAYLWFKSRYVPRSLAAWGVVSSVFAGFCGFAYLLFPGFGEIVAVDWYELPTALFELGISVWVLVKGLRLPESAGA